MPEVFSSANEDQPKNKVLLNRVTTSKKVIRKSGKEREKIKVKDLMNNGVLPMESKNDVLLQLGSNFLMDTKDKTKDEKSRFIEKTKDSFQTVQLLELPTEGEWIKTEKKISSKSQDVGDLLSLLEGLLNTDVQVESETVDYSRSRNKNYKNIYKQNIKTDNDPVIIRNYKIEPTGEFDDFGNLEYSIVFEQFKKSE